MKRIVLLVIGLALVVGCGTTNNNQQSQSSVAVSDEALNQLVSQVQSDSTSWENHYKLAQAYLSRKNYDAAETEFNIAQSLNPLALDVTMGQAEMYRQMERVVDSYSLYLKVIKTQGGEKYIPQISQRVGQPYETRQLTRGEFNNAAASYAPDDNMLVFQSDRDGNMEIYTLEIETDRVQRITNNPARDELPTIAANGKFIAFNSTRNDSSDRAQAERMRDIYLYNLESGALVQLTKTEEDDWYAGFHPNSEEVVFTSTRGDIRDIEYSKMWSDIYLTQLKNSNTLRLTQSKYQNGSPAFAPNGKWIAFNANPDEKYHLYRMWLKEQKIDQLTFHNGNDAAPNVSQDNNRIVFFSDTNGNFDLFMLDLNSGAQQQLTSQSFNEAYPRFSHNGKKIVYQAQIDKYYQLFELNFDLPISKNSLVKMLEEQMTNLSQQTAKK